MAQQILVRCDVFEGTNHSDLLLLQIMCYTEVTRSVTKFPRQRSSMNFHSVGGENADRQANVPIIFSFCKSPKFERQYCNAGYRNYISPEHLRFYLTFITHLRLNFSDNNLSFQVNKGKTIDSERD
jgi:hypothetical protein